MARPKILVVHPGASFSTHDVYVGLCEGLRANGIDVVEFRLDLNIRILNAMIDAAVDVGTLTEPIQLDAYVCQGVIAMAGWHQPDWVIAVSGGNLHVSAPLTLRKMGLKTAVYCTESPYYIPLERQFGSCYDVVFTNERQSIPAFTGNTRVHYLAHAYNPRIHTPGPAEPDKSCDAFFVGTGFPERKALFDGVNWSNLSFVKKGYLWGDDVAADELNPKDVTDNAEVVRWYRSARVNINHHRTTTFYGRDEHVAAGDATCLGPRAYEIAACGGFQLLDDSREEAWEVFGDSLTTYRAGDSADLERQIRHWLKHPDRREEAARMQHAAVQPHSWHARAAQLLTILL